MGGNNADDRGGLARSASDEAWSLDIEEQGQHDAGANPFETHTPFYILAVAAGRSR